MTIIKELQVISSHGELLPGVNRQVAVTTQKSNKKTQKPRKKTVTSLQ